MALAWCASQLVGLYRHFTDLEHGAACTVPRAWRSQVSLCSAYALSSLHFSVAGFVMMYAFARRPDRLLYPGEQHEAWLWVWQGLVSFQCDAVDLGIPSWSHPVDRLSATLVILHQCAKHYAAMWRGEYSGVEAGVLNAGMAAGLLCYRRSCDAVHSKSLRGYLFWHAAWHLVLPTMMIVFCALRYQ